MNYRILLVLIWFTLTVSLRASERISALIDQPSYLAGECLQVCVKVDGISVDDPISRVAYVELSDTRHLCAQAMVALTEGYGWASLNLPTSLHSGYYLLSVYTREQLQQHEAKPFTQLVAVINMQQLSRQDDVRFLPVDTVSLSESLSVLQPQSIEYTPGEPLLLPIPQQMHDARLASVSLIGQMLQPEPAECDASQLLPQNINTILNAEAEGHQVMARVVGNHRVNQCMLSTVGKAINLYAGQLQADETWAFYTDAQLCGSLPVALTATDFDGHNVPMDFVSPYLRLLPKELPTLSLSVVPAQLRARSIAAQQLHVVLETATDTLPSSELFLGSKPAYDYTMSEWAKFSTISEIITEFVHGAHRGMDAGIRRLFIVDPADGQLSQCPALLLLDGVPVYDTDKLLKYDARLLEHVRIYQGRYVFGSQIYCGVISFTTQRGRLSNYRLDAGTRLVNYTFAQNRPSFVTYPGQTSGTLCWLPYSSFSDSAVTITAPSAPGMYSLLFQWIDDEGNLCRQITDLCKK